MKIGKLAKAVKITDPLEMVGFLRTNGTTCQFVSMLTVTEPKLKKSCPYVGVKKISRRNGLLNVNFNTAVRKRLSESLGLPMNDVEYVNGKTWFVHEMTSDGKALPLVKHETKNDGKFYVQYFPIRSSGTKYVLPNGETVSESVLEQYFYARSESEFKPATCVFHVENITELRASKVIIQTDDTENVETILAQ